ncbi:hypothetical protein VTO42DRAFT_8726 [Malbranchea cinnamomea]
MRSDWSEKAIPSDSKSKGSSERGRGNLLSDQVGGLFRVRLRHFKTDGSAEKDSRSGRKARSRTTRAESREHHGREAVVPDVMNGWSVRSGRWGCCRCATPLVCRPVSARLHGILIPSPRATFGRVASTVTSHQHLQLWRDLDARSTTRLLHVARFAGCGARRDPSATRVDCELR